MELYNTRYENGYNIPDQRYSLWLSLTHPGHATTVDHRRSQ